MEIKYRDKIVAFIDVLGFSNLVYSENTDIIKKYFDYVLDDFKLPIAKNKFNYYLISDSIVITAPNSKKSLIIMIQLLCFLQSKLMFEGILVRGAVSFGNLYANKSKNIIVGPGLINAYKMESKAVYPRIILDRVLISKYMEGTKNAIEFFRNSAFNFLIYTPPFPYKADFLYINYTRSALSLQSWKLFQSIIDIFKNNFYRNENIEKYEWLRTNILASANEQKKHMEELTTDSYYIRRRKKHIQKFIDEFIKL